MSDPLEPGLTDGFGDTLRAFVRREIARALDGLWTCLPGIVQTTGGTAKKPTVDVQPVPQVYRVDDAGNRASVAHPVIPGVPVVFPGGGGEGVFSWALNAGDPVLLVFASRSIDLWASGPVNANPDPQDVRTHDLGDAVAIPWAWGYTAPTRGIVRDGDTVTIPKAGLQALLDLRYQLNAPPVPLPTDATGTVASTSAVKSA
ncbi:MAG: Gp138 family membrane-puncturing spike protein [Terriglobales bacterium]